VDEREEEDYRPDDEESFLIPRRPQKVSAENLHVQDIS
jgi:hypothetical protein